MIKSSNPADVDGAALLKAKTVKIVNGEERYVGKIATVRGFTVQLDEKGAWTGVTYDVEMSNGARKTVAYDDIQIEDFCDG